MAADDRPRDTTSADAPAGPQQRQPAGRRDKPPKAEPTQEPRTDVAEPVVDPQTEAPTPAPTEPTSDPTTEPPTTDPPPTDPPPTQPPPTQPPPTQPPPTQPPPTQPPQDTVRLTGVDARQPGPPVLAPWEMGATVAVAAEAPVTVKIEYNFTGLVLLLGASGSGWDCVGRVSAVNPLDGPVTCTYSSAGGALPEVVVKALSPLDDLSSSAPAASVKVYADGTLVDSGTF